MGGLVGGVLALLFSLLVIFVPDLATILGWVSCLVVPIVATYLAISMHTNAVGAITAGEGAKLGALALALAGLLSSVIMQLLQLVHVVPTQQEIMDRQWEIQAEKMSSQGMSAEQIEQARAMGESIAGVFTNPVVAIISSVAMYAILGAVIGAIAAAVLSKNKSAQA